MALRIVAIQSGALSGSDNMALDEALLEWVRLQPERLLVVRTYQWDVLTLSLGVNQPEKDSYGLLKLYGQASSGQQRVQAVVRRPTGGRAILHGKDISCAFVTNDPEVLKKSLKEAYGIYSGWVQQALLTLGVSAQSSETRDNRNYLRSPACFETFTPSDLLGPNGKKLFGSAQLRRSGGLLQHGAAFLAPYNIEEAALFLTLCETIGDQLKVAPELTSVAAMQSRLPEWEALRAAYRKSAGDTWARASTTSGSHLEPASC